MARRINPLLVLPVAVFAVFCGTLALQLTRAGDDSLPSVLIGKSAPAFEPAPFGSHIRPTDAELRAPGPKLVNFWASWCAPCRVEHPNLTLLAERGVPILGVNYKDREANGLSFLAELGDPYSAIGADPHGRIAIDWGVYGVPETFVVDGDGKVSLRYAGPITASVLAERILPEIERLSENPATDGTTQ